jgi:hypothetical protein
MSISRINGEGDFLIKINLFDYKTYNPIDHEVTKFVNGCVKDIIRVLIDYLEDSNDFNSEDFLPFNNFKISDCRWRELVYDLYDIISSDVLRDYVKPIYDYLLYAILEWWEDCACDEEILLNKLSYELKAKIQTEYMKDEGEYIINEITTYNSYYYILFADHDFLPDSLEQMVTIFLRNPEFFSVLFADVNLSEYKDIMPKDLREQFENIESILSRPKMQNDYYASLLVYLLSCCKSLQANVFFKNAKENNMNDFIRELLSPSYEVKDQTRQGSSSGKKDSGEVDILIKKDNLEASIIEALVLNYMDKTRISEHIDKIYSYDSIGNPYNYILSYVRAKDFSGFWTRYLSYVKQYDYPYEMISFTDEPGKQYPELRYALVVLKRNDITTRLYHIAVHMPT